MSAFKVTLLAAYFQIAFGQTVRNTGKLLLSSRKLGGFAFGEMQKSAVQLQWYGNFTIGTELCAPRKRTFSSGGKKWLAACKFHTKNPRKNHNIRIGCPFITKFGLILRKISKNDKFLLTTGMPEGLVKNAPPERWRAAHERREPPTHFC